MAGLFNHFNPKQTGRDTQVRPVLGGAYWLSIIRTVIGNPEYSKADARNEINTILMQAGPPLHVPGPPNGDPVTQGDIDGRKMDADERADFNALFDEIQALRAAGTDQVEKRSKLDWYFHQCQTAVVLSELSEGLDANAQDGLGVPIPGGWGGLGRHIGEAEFRALMSLPTIP